MKLEIRIYRRHDFYADVALNITEINSTSFIFNDKLTLMDNSSYLFLNEYITK